MNESFPRLISQRLKSEPLNSAFLYPEIDDERFQEPDPVTIFLLMREELTRQGRHEIVLGATYMTLNDIRKHKVSEGKPVSHEDLQRAEQAAAAFARSDTSALYFERLIGELLGRRVNLMHITVQMFEGGIVEHTFGFDYLDQPRETQTITSRYL